MDKRNIASSTPYTFDIEKLEHIQPIVATTKQNKKEVGVIAQDLIALEPIFVKHLTAGPLIVDYEKLTVMLLSIVKQQEERLKALEAKKTPAKKTAKKVL